MYPILFEVWGFQISSFGVLVAMGALLGGRIFATGLEERGYDRERAWSVLFWALVGGVLGSKIWFTCEMLARGATLAELFPDWQSARGGLTWYGGLVGGTLGAMLAARLYRIPVVLATHFAAPATALGQCLGRIGCLMVGDDYGSPTDLPWGIAFPEGQPPIDVPVHPTMVYEAIWLALITWLLWSRRNRSRNLLPEYFVLAGVGRFLDEFLRTNPPLLGPLSNAQVTALVSVLLGGALMLYVRSSERTSALPISAETS